MSKIITIIASLFRSLPFFLTMAILAIWVLAGTPGCKQAYTPPIISSPNTYLVVEGFINNGPDSTYFTLTHTYKLDDTSTVTPELHAQVTVEGKDNSSYPLTEIGNGRYGMPLPGLNNAITYRLHIHTVGGKDYLSDYVQMKPSPPIDSVSWTLGGKGVQIYANTHDPQNTSRYYRWDYQQTYEFHSAYYATLTWLNNKVSLLSPNTYYQCWQGGFSSNILLASSAKLAQDEIYLAPLVLVPTGDIRISVEYSILVTQYVLTPDAFAWWQNMQKNTEQIGSIFGVQPSTIKGNIHNTADSTEMVIGYVSGGTVARQRIFINNSQVQPWGYRSGCFEINVTPDSVLYWIQGGFLLIDEYPSLDLRYDMAQATCVNCTLSGTNQKPTFWP